MKHHYSKSYFFHSHSLIELFNLFLDHGAKVSDGYIEEIKAPESKESSILMALLRAYESVYGKNIKFTDKQLENLVQKLLDAGAKPLLDHEDDKYMYKDRNKTPIDLAILNKSTELALLMLRNLDKTNVNLDKYLVDVLELRCPNLRVFQYLIEHGAGKANLEQVMCDVTENIALLISYHLDTNKHNHFSWWWGADIHYDALEITQAQLIYLLDNYDLNVNYRNQNERPILSTLRDSSPLQIIFRDAYIKNNSYLSQHALMDKLLQKGARTDNLYLFGLESLDECLTKRGASEELRNLFKIYSQINNSSSDSPSTGKLQ